LPAIGYRPATVGGKFDARDLCGFEMDLTGFCDTDTTSERWNASASDWSSELEQCVSREVCDEGKGGEPTRGIGAPGGHAVAARSAACAEPAQAKRATISPARPRLPEVPGYEILEELGRGGMGIVYKARQIRLNRIVALKMILAGDFAGHEAVDRIISEAKIVARLQHPNIVQIYATGDCEGRPYVELEYVPGGSLAARLDGTPWHPRAAARLVEQLALAMADAHRLGIVHRDLKPANILMTDEGVPKITDFGLAKSLEKDSGLTRTQSILGSPRYMAPEQAEGNTKSVGPAADVYALGTNLYELLTGRPPFIAPTVLATLDLVKNAEPVPPGRLQPNLPRDLETICLKCLRKESLARYATAQALAQDLSRYLDGEPILARPTSRSERMWKWVRRRPSLAALVVVSTLSILAAALGVFWYVHDQQRQREQVARRIDAIRDQIRKFVSLGEDALGTEDYPGARIHFQNALMLARGEPKLSPLGSALANLLDRADRKIDERTERDDARKRLAAFQKSYNEAVFYQSQYTGLDPEANVRASRQAAKVAVDQFARDVRDGTLALSLLHFTAAEIDQINARYYEVSLIQAEATAQTLTGEDPVSQAKQALDVLGKIAQFHALTPIYHVRRAAYLERAGDRFEARAELTSTESKTDMEHSAVDDFLEGESAYHAHEYKRAVQAFRRVLAREADHFWALYLMAVCQLKEHHAAEAHALLTACQTRRPGFVWTYLLRGFAEGEMREFDLAEEDFARAAVIGLGPAERYVMLVNRGVMRVKRGRHESAAQDFAEAIRLNPDQYQAYINLSQVFQSLDRLDEAARTLDRAIARDPRQPVLFRARAQLRRLRSNDEDALQDLASAIEYAAPDDSGRTDDHLERARILERSARHALALAECNRALELNPSRLDIHQTRGAVLVKLGRFEEAIDSFDICMARCTASPALHEARGLALAYVGSYDRAIDDYTMALSAGLRTATLYSHRGWAYLFSGAYKPAKRDFDEALRLDPTDAHGLSGRALANVQLRDIPGAVADAFASYKNNARDPRLYYNAARVLSQAASFLEAESPRSGANWAAAGRYRKESVALIEKALDLMPATERQRFWTKVVMNDSALEPIKKSRRYRELEAENADSSVGNLSARGIPR
jgi:tetratricopeptide (TPR) repeat protein/tRNA A-37 threonylcarbamoyl transferase component Bud32